MVSQDKQQRAKDLVAEHGVEKAAEILGVAPATALRYCKPRSTQRRITQPWLVFGDLHAPYQHRKTLDFLQHVHKAYKCRDEVYCTGDLFDFHAMSRHTTELDSPSPDVEYHRACEFAAELTAIFPNGTLVLGNHDCIPQRQMAGIGISLHLLKSHNDLYNLPEGWKVQQLYATTDKDVLIEHGIGSSGMNGAINTAVKKCTNYVQGHQHAFAGVWYRANHATLRYAMNTGCLADHTALALRYGKYQAQKGVLGCGLLYPASSHVGEHAVFIPMNA